MEWVAIAGIVNSHRQGRGPVKGWGGWTREYREGVGANESVNLIVLNENAFL